MALYTAKLSAIAEALFDPEIKGKALFDTCDDYLKVLIKASSFVAQESSELDVHTTSGSALAPRWAIQCIKDLQRTKQYTLGLFKAVNESLKKDPNTPVHILYAGTGPFASLVLPLTTRFTPQQLQFTLLEVNPESMAWLDIVIKQFKLEDYIIATELTDAATYKIDKSQTIDIVLSETMTAGLKNEPQVAISYALMDQLPEKTILVPEQIQLSMCLVNADKFYDYKLSKGDLNEAIKDLGVVFTLDKKHIAKHGTLFKKEYPNVAFPEQIIPIPKGANRHFDAIQLKTDITVFKDIKLESDQSGITNMLNIISFADSMIRFNAISTQYISDHRPGLDCNIIP